MKNELTPSIATMEATMACYGYKVQARDPLRNPEFPGKWMLVDTEESAESDGYCIVGDNKAELIADAFAWLVT